MRLASACGLNVAPVTIIAASGKDVLLIERFDRIKVRDGWQRRAMVSALTMLGLDEMMARYASYEDLAEIIRHRFTDPKDTLKELYGRICFNILCGNTDDHARNHAAFWDGKMLTLTPAYDICPQGRAGGEATQAMLIKGENRMSGLSTSLAAAEDFLLTEDEAIAIIEGQISTIAGEWDATCEGAGLSPTDKNLFAGRQFLNPYCIEGLGDEHAKIISQFQDARGRLTG
jgi:serine/threonine-protein kinase HipA